MNYKKYAKSLMFRQVQKSAKLFSRVGKSLVISE